MAYIGNSPALKYASFEVQHFTTSATTSYVLSYSVANENEIALFVNNVRQQPGGSYAYTAAGTTLTLSAATTTSDTMYAVFIGKAVQTVIPPVNSVGTSQLVADSVTQAKMADDSVGTAEILDTNVTGAKLNDDAISGQGALGAEPADTDEFLVSDAGVLKRVDYSYIKASTTDEFRPTAQALIYNGDAAIAQRGTSQTGVTSGPLFPVDRFQFYPTSLGTYTIIQEALTSGAAYDQGFRTALRIDTTTADASPGSTDYVYLSQKFEGNDLQVLKKGTSNAEKLTLAFWVKSNKTTTGQVNLFDYDNNRIVSGTYTTDVADTWEKKIIVFAADTSDPLTIDNALSFGIEWFLDSGSNFSSGTAPTAWEDQVNGDRNVSNFAIGSSTDNDFAITGVQLEVGEFTSATLPPFQFESYGDNLQRCQRYFQTIADGSWSSNETISNGFWQTSSAFFFTVRLAVEMRANPSLITTMGTNYINIHIGGGSDAGDNIATYSGSTKRAFGLNAAANSAGTQGEGGQIMLNSASAFVAGNAEL